VIWVYTVTESNELQARDASSLQELQSLSREVDWLWIDCMDLGDKEFSVPHVVFLDELKTFPIYVFMKEGMFLTVRNKHSSKPVKNAFKTFEDCVGKVCEGSINSSFILSRLFYEISNENLDVVMALRENIDKIEERALASPGDKRISRSVFVIKREISALERILWSQRELMLSIREGVVLMVKPSEEIRATLSHAVNNISRELSLLDSDNNALDSVLSLQDLGMIHKVERNLIYLTLIALVVSVLLILLEIDIINLFATFFDAILVSALFSICLTMS